MRLATSTVATLVPRGPVRIMGTSERMETLPTMIIQFFSLPTKAPLVRPGNQGSEGLKCDFDVAALTLNRTFSRLADNLLRKNSFIGVNHCEQRRLALSDFISVVSSSKVFSYRVSAPWHWHSLSGGLSRLRLVHWPNLVSWLVHGARTLQVR